MKTWTTQTGKELNIKDMSTDHIQNSIEYLQRKIDNGDTIVSSGSMGMDGIPEYYDADDAKEIFEEQIEVFKSELKERKAGD